MKHPRIQHLLSFTAAVTMVAAFFVAPSRTAQAEAGKIPEKIMFPDSGCWGLVIHSPYRAEALKDLGVQWVRLSVRWNNVEREQRGSYDWSEIDRLLDFYLEHDFKVLAILTLEDLAPPYEADKDKLDLVLDAVTRWCGAAAERYKGRGIVWELSNEPEVFPMGGYWNVPLTYGRMARQAAAAITKADPDAKIAAPSTGWMDRGFIEQAIAAGMLRDGNIDILSFHGYSRANLLPESGLMEDVTWLRKLLRRSAPRQQIILADTERGYCITPPSEPKDWGSWRNIVYSESEQAAYLARHYLEEIFLGIEISVWYKDMAGENNYSLFYNDEKDPRGLRPMGHVYRNLARLLPENPKTLRNDTYGVTLVDLPDNISAPDSSLPVRSYLRSYLDKGQQRQRLIVAAWNPVEAFDGKILESRTFVGNGYVEKWRPITKDDLVDIPVQIQIAGLKTEQVASMHLYDLTATTADAALQSPPLAPEPMKYSIRTPVLKVGPMPTVVVIELASSE